MAVGDTRRGIVTRRESLAGGLALLGSAALLAWPRPAAARDLYNTLAGILPPALDPAAFGVAMCASARREGALLDTATCLRMAGGPSDASGWSWVAAQVAQDFSEGRIVDVMGWQLAHTEAWLCAALMAHA